MYPKEYAHYILGKDKYLNTNGQVANISTQCPERKIEVAEDPKGLNGILIN